MLLQFHIYSMNHNLITSTEALWKDSHQLNQVVHLNAPILRFIRQNDYEYQQQSHQFIENFHFSCHDPHQTQKNMTQLEANPSRPQIEPRQNVQQSQTDRIPSVFHNFQKHLFGLLRRIVTIKRQDLGVLPCESCAYDLWSIFLNIRSNNQKVLYAILGLNNKQIKLERVKGNGLKSIQKYSPEVIKEGQKILRQIFIRRCSSVLKHEFMLLCKVKKIDQFFNYFQIFKQNLSENAKIKRINKKKLMRNINRTDSE